MRRKSLTVGIDVMARCYLSIDFCASSSSCCCIMVANSPSLMIIYSFFSRFCISSSSSLCSAKVRWACLEISALSSGGLEMAITAYHSWGELIYHLFGTYLLQYIFDHQFQKGFLLVLQQCGKYCVIIIGKSTPFEISGFDIDLVDGAQCKCKRKHWFMFYAFPWTCQETDYFRLSCELVRWLTIYKYQELGMVYRAHAGEIEGVASEGGSVSWGGAQTKGEMHKSKLTNKIFLHSDLLTSLIYSLTQLCFTIRKLALQGNEVKL